MSQKTISEIEQELGPHSEFIITNSNRYLVRQWAILKGVNPVSVNVMNNAKLVNLYHENLTSDNQNNDPSEAQLLAADMLIKLMNVFQTTDIDPEIIREIITPGPITELKEVTHYKTETIIKIVSINHPVMMVGPAGCGKTTIGENVSKALNLPFYVTSTINDTHELNGFVDGYGKYHTTPFRQAFQNGGVWVADEIDAWDASALLAANSALANGFTTFPNSPEPILRHADFRMIATANTFGSGADRVYVGRNELDAASLDRFATVDVDYDLTLEKMFSRGNDKWLNHVWKIRKLVQEKKIRHVVSSRAIIMGAIALEVNLKWSDVEEIYLFKGMSENNRKKLKD